MKVELDSRMMTVEAAQQCEKWEEGVESPGVYLDDSD